MKVFDKVRLVVYRIQEKGLEVFLVDSQDGNRSEEFFSIPEGASTQSFIKAVSESGLKLIKLDPVAQANGNMVAAYAIEGDWHDLPSIKAMVNSDIEKVKAKILDFIPEKKPGAYVLVKDAFKKVLPYEYSILKELKEILTEKNSIQNI
jgi:hypothetical protein